MRNVKKLREQHSVKTELTAYLRHVAEESARTVGWIDSPLMYGSVRPLQKAQKRTRLIPWLPIVCHEDFGQHTVWGHWQKALH